MPKEYKLTKISPGFALVVVEGRRAGCVTRRGAHTWMGRVAYFWHPTVGTTYPPERFTLRASAAQFVAENDPGDGPWVDGWWEEYRCGCVSDTVYRKRDLPGYCGRHGADRRYAHWEKPCA